jgi:hypothetical protein
LVMYTIRPRSAGVIGGAGLPHADSASANIIAPALCTVG